MSSGLDITSTTIGGGARGAIKIEFFLSDRDGASELRVRGGEVYAEISQRLRSLFSVRIELNCPTHHPNAQGEWIVLTGSSRDNLERAKEYILKSFGSRCRVELASIDTATVSSQSSLSSQSSSTPMAHAVYNDGPPPLTSSSSCSYSSSSLSSGCHGTTPVNLCSRSSSLSPPYHHQSPSPSSPSKNTLLEHRDYNHQTHNLHPRHHQYHVPTTSTSPYHPPNIDVCTREEPTPVTSTFDSEEQLRNAILQLPPEKLKNLLLDATMAGGRHRGTGTGTGTGTGMGPPQKQFQHQQQQQLPPNSNISGGARAMQCGRDCGSSGGGGSNGARGGGGRMLLSRSPDQREKKIEYFVNTLNYPREKVESVLDQLGPDAADNDILERLVKVCRPGSGVQAKVPPSVGAGGVGYSTRPGGPNMYAPTGASSGGMIGIGDSVPPRSQLSPPPPMAPSAVTLPTTTMPVTTDPARLRHIVIDGSNVAMRHGNGNFYSCRGIQLAVDYFRKRGHKEITVFVPEWRKEASKPETPITEQEILHILEREDILKYTPSRRIRGKRVACYDDRFILDLATHKDGVIVSNDQFRDLMDDKPEWREVIETRLLPFQFVNDYFMVAQDPMGKDGPMLDDILVVNPGDVPGRPQKPSLHVNQSNRQPCPYKEKCTFGRKCKFYHPERDQRNETVRGVPSGATSAPGAPQNSMSPISSRTPNASRSTTPSPSPEKWSHGGGYNNSNRSSGEDLRQLASNGGSTDDLTHYQGGGGGGVSGGGGGTMKLAELVQGQLGIHDGGPAPQGGAGAGGGYYRHPRPVPPNSMNFNPPSGSGGGGGIHSAPVFSTNSAESAASTPGHSAAAGDISQPQHLSHRYTFPMAVLPQAHHIKSSRTHIHTEHHHLSSTLTPTQAAGGMGGASTGGGSGLALHGHGHGHEVTAADPSSVMYPSFQLQQDPAAAAISHHPHHHSHHHGQQQPTIPPGMFMPRDSWPYPPPPPPTGTAVTPHELHPHHSHGGSLMQAQAGFYPPPNQQGGGPQLHQAPPPDPPGYNSRAATSSSESNRHLLQPQPHSMGSSVVNVPCTHTSPYHHPHSHQSQPHDLQHQHSRHHSIDYGLHSQQTVSPHRKRSYSNDVHKQPNGHLPQVASSPALVGGGGGGGGGGGPYNYDYSAIPPGTCSSTGGGGSSSGRPNFHGHQSSSTSAFYSHPPPPPPPQSSAPIHYNHRLPAVSEAGASSVNMDMYQKLSALFPGCDDRIWTVMTANPHILEIEKLVSLIQQ